jgi:hypothetical protein
MRAVPCVPCDPTFARRATPARHVVRLTRPSVGSFEDGGETDDDSDGDGAGLIGSSVGGAAALADGKRGGVAWRAPPAVPACAQQPAWHEPEGGECAFATPLPVSRARSHVRAHGRCSAACHGNADGVPDEIGSRFEQLKLENDALRAQASAA